MMNVIIFAGLFSLMVAFVAAGEWMGDRIWKK